MSIKPVSGFLFLIRNYYHVMIIALILIIAVYITYQRNNAQVTLNYIKARQNNIQKSRQKQTQIKYDYFKKIQQNQKNINDKLLPNNNHNLYDPESHEYKQRELIEHYLSLKDLYYNGIPDKYDNNGTKIKGIPPDPNLAINYLDLAIKAGYHKGWIELGNMYHYGFYMFPSNLDMAINIYKHIIDTIPDIDLSNEAIQLYNDAVHENHTINTHKWLNLPYTTKIKPKQTLYEIEQNKAKRLPLLKPTIFFGTNLGTDMPNIDINTLFRTTRDGGNNVALPEEKEDERKIKNDMHNVHSHSVIATIKQSLDKLKKDTPMKKNTSTCLHEIRQYLNSLPNNDKKNDAILTLDTAEKSYLPISFTDLKETDALALVWNRISSDKHANIAKTLKENLADELAECIEHGKPVCVTGRFSRILDTLNGIDEAVTIKPTFVINEEMMTKASKIRNELYDNLTNTEKKQVDDMIENLFQKQWMKKLKDEIRKRLHDDYVKSDILTESGFNTEINKWIDEI